MECHAKKEAFERVKYPRREQLGVEEGSQIRPEEASFQDDLDADTLLHLVEPIMESIPSGSNL